LIEEQRKAAISTRQEKIASAKTETSTLLESEKQLLQNQASEAKAVIAGEAEAMAEKISNNILKA
jgi:hypothetical protein